MAQNNVYFVHVPTTDEFRVAQDDLAPQHPSPTISTRQMYHYINSVLIRVLCAFVIISKQAVNYNIKIDHRGPHVLRHRL